MKRLDGIGLAVPKPHRERHAVVLLHASASSARQWDRLVEDLGPDAEVHAIDLHGHGSRGPHPGGQPLALHHEAALLQPLLARAGRVHLVGHSYGGAVALHLALHQPERVRSLALYEPVAFSLLAEQDRGSPATHDLLGVAEALRRLHRQGREALAAERFIDYWSGPGSWARMGPARQASIVDKVPLLAAHFAALAAEPSPAPKLPRLNLPLLCLSGAATTPAARRIAELLRQGLPQARHETLPGLGHMGPVTHPQRVNAWLLEFLRRQPGLLAPSTDTAPAAAWRQAFPDTTTGPAQAARAL